MEVSRGKEKHANGSSPVPVDQFSGHIAPIGKATDGTITLRQAFLEDVCPPLPGADAAIMVSALSAAASSP